VVKADTHNQGVMSSNSCTIYWMDVSDAKLLYKMKITKIKAAKWDKNCVAYLDRLTQQGKHK
jgi:hypothetical protein